MIGAVQPGGGGALWTTIQDRNEKGRSQLLSPKGEQIRFCKALKYLGLWFDGKLTFNEHAKAERIVVSIRWLMSNTGGLSEVSVRLTNIAMSVFLYGDPIWADTNNAREYQRTEMVSVQWKTALRCFRAYHTVSTEAVCVLTCIPRSK